MISPMRIVLIGPVPPFRGGIAHYTSQLSLALVAEGHDLTLISFRRQYPRWLFPGESDRDPSLQQIETISAHFWLDSLNPLTWLTTFQRIRSLKPDFIILPWWTVFWGPAWFVLGALNRFFGGSVLVIHCHNVLPHDSGAWQKTVTKLVFRWADRFVVQSADELRRLRDLLPHAAAQIGPLPVIQMIPKLELGKDDAKKRLGIDPVRPVLLFFGIVRPYKGVDILLEALPPVCQEIPNLLLLIAGEFWESLNQYQDQIQRLGLGHAVRIDNRYILNEEVALLFAAADLVVAPYRYVTGSAVIQLARGFGVPIVASGMTDQDAGVRIVPVEDPAALATGIIRSLQTLPSHPQIDSGPDRDTGWERLVNALVGTTQPAQPSE
jgi:glycosyltransferase involved in cell wall biosynthesis